MFFFFLNLQRCQGHSDRVGSAASVHQRELASAAHLAATTGQAAEGAHRAGTAVGGTGPRLQGAQTTSP